MTKDSETREQETPARARRPAHRRRLGWDDRGEQIASPPVTPPPGASPRPDDKETER